MLPHLDGLLYQETDLNIEEHFTDSEGYTDQVFAMCHLLGFRFAPRIRDLKDRRIFTIEKPSRYPDLSPLVGGTVRTRQIETHWDEVLRLASSVKTGAVTASLILGKLASPTCPDRTFAGAAKRAVLAAFARGFRGIVAAPLRVVPEQRGTARRPSRYDPSVRAGAVADGVIGVPEAAGCTSTR